MKLYLLRHEEHDLGDASFYSSLNSDGLDCANKLKYTLEYHNINLLFCSPFKRTLLTIKPYCEMKNLLVNIDYSLYDVNVESKRDLLPSDDEYILKNMFYISFTKFNDIKKDNGFERSQGFLNYLLTNYKDLNFNILLITHGEIIKNIVNKEDFKIPPMGGLVCLDTDNNTVEKVNYCEKTVRFENK